MQNFLAKAGGLFNRLTGGSGQLGLGALMYGSSQIQEPLKRAFGLPTTGDYLRQWEAKRSSQKRPEGYSTYGTYTVGGIEYDTASGRPTYMPPGSVYPSSSVAPFTPAAERAYETEKSRVAQLTAQDPELKRYEDARIKAVAPGATPEQVQSAEDIGMQIWQQKYGNTPMGQPGGAVGRFNPLMDRTFGYQSGSAPGQQIGAPTLGPSPLVPQVDQSLNPASPSFIGGEGGPLMNFADENLTPEMIEAYQKQLLSQAASRK